ncbi:DUF21 domain-containing protein [Alkaliphilus sp. MSJ-5]|uniref:DUF21 domain-containing protein n=1 Tax=Alkaliphilus flagellatus TaxID=2841507 RepID=A0ABS6FY63_9FIRM|nr:CNNM domain-containing protein [Alkaliphilus flagellatus]MBU5675170.1 DUF21 domain-containing protein [Alkaliphilus flagellatus]
MDPDSMWQIIVLLGLLFCSAFFSTSETALMSLSKIRVRYMVEEKVKGGDLVERLVKDPNKLLGTILVGNNIVNIGASALATSLALDFFGSKGVFVSTGIMTLLVLIFGEITPKSLAAQFPEKVSLKVSKPLSFIVTLLNPIVIVLMYLTNGIMNILGIKADKAQPIITEEELRTIVAVSEEEGVLETEETQMIHNVFEFGDLQIKDVMIQRTDIVAIDIDLPFQQIIDKVKDEQFSRYPIYKEGIDNIIGVLNVRDLIFLDNKKDNFNIEEYVRKPYYTFEFKKISDTFTEMKKNRTHMAIVLDEYGGTAGIITIEDLIEEIVGDIEDEYDEFESEIQFVKDGEYIIIGSTKINSVNEILGTNFESEDFDSIGGLVIESLGRLPKLGEKVEYDNITLIVESIERNRIKTVKVYV